MYYSDLAKRKKKKKIPTLQTHFDGETSYEYLPNAYFVFRTAGPGDTEGEKNIYILSSWTEILVEAE